MSDDPDYKLPQRIELTDLEGKPALPTVPNDLTADAIPLVEEPQTYELDRKPEAPMVEKRPSMVPRIVLGAMLGLAVIAGSVMVFRIVNAPKTARFEIVNVQPGSTLELDGGPIVGRSLLLPISNEQHVLTIVGPNHTHKTKKFTAEHDATIDVSVPW